MTDLPPAPEQQPVELKIDSTLELFGGVWANFARVSHSPHEITIDFIRLDYSTVNPRQGVVVQRVNISPLFAKQLIDALIKNLDSYGKTMPDGFVVKEDL
ncbi:MAG: DUF3467 domain-containing protein [Acidimicrobiaceae bacterium]|nr:DUF3467 domain-containing protein [Acidimicrobiaceae bacterium]